MRRCIYCGGEFDPAHNRPEHIVLASLGGKRASRHIVCSECNGHFSGDIDRSIADSLRLLRCILSIPRSGPPTATARGADSGKKYRVYPDGRRTLLDVEVESQSAPGSNPETKRITGSPRNVIRIAEGLAKRHGGFKATDITGITHREMLQPVDPMQIGGSQYQCIAKMSFNFLAIAPGVPQNLVLTEQFDEIRRFIRNGTEFVRFPVMLDLRDLLELGKQPQDCFCNRIAISCDPASNNAVAVVEILSELKCSVLLSRNYNGPRISAMLSNYPHKRKRDEVKTDLVFPIVKTSTVLNRGSAEGWLQDLQISMNALLERVIRYDEERYFQVAVCNAFDEIAPSGITDENVDMVARFLAERIAEEFLSPGGVSKRRYHSWEEFRDSYDDNKAL